jgi:hypothetical protein
MANEREPRTATEGRERRRRVDGTLDRMSSLKLAIPHGVEDKYPDKDFRWFNDIGNRIHSKTVLDDWDKVPGVDPVNVDFREGQPVKAFLCMKPKEFVREDSATKEADLREQEAGILNGGTSESDLSGKSYAAQGNSIRRGRSSP